MQPTRVRTEDPISAAMRLEQELALRTAEIVNKTALVCMQPPKERALSDAVSLLGSALSRSVALQTSWAHQWLKWGAYAQSIQGADTIAKYSDRMGNIALQAEAQVANQITEGLELADNVAVSYAYWLTRQLEDASQPRSSSTEPTE